ncbi:tyrosine-type recombinase/integrase [Planctomicrobium sp. SH527]|uniref:tyrosine-type recombinase/integrase n=1 Tax=Planctomicrobium sp. SH527 TaxID=3448123 RepID=UPI003F5C49E6
MNSPLSSQPEPHAASNPHSRRMVAAELLGSHTHVTTNGISVTISQRDGKLLARGRWEGKQFGQTLGADPRVAASELRRLLVEIESGAFLPPSESRRRLLPSVGIPRLTFRQLCDQFLDEKRQLRGRNTTTDYLNRLRPVLDFAERQENLRKWKLARDINREFALALRDYLTRRETTRNGRPGASVRRMSLRQVQNCLETARMVLAWALRAEVRKLPPEFVQPITSEIIGGKPPKDPLRPVLVPLNKRIELIENMDDWQLLTLSCLSILPLRFEDPARLLISDVDFSRGTLRLGSHFGGADCNKGKVEVTMPLPPELVKVFQICVGDRKDGPLFLSRNACANPERFQTSWNSPDDLQRAFEDRLCQSKRPINNPQDRKILYCQLMKDDLGAVSADRVGKEMKQLFRKAGLRGVRPYEIRSGVTTEMARSGMSHLEMTYLTEHTVKDIMNTYTALDPVAAMTPYFRKIEPLLEVLRQRLEDFKIPPFPLSPKGGVDTIVMRQAPAAPISQSAVVHRWCTNGAPVESFQANCKSTH